jgi:hypothetical protein
MRGPEMAPRGPERPGRNEDVAPPERPGPWPREAWPREARERRPSKCSVRGLVCRLAPRQMLFFGG